MKRLTRDNTVPGRMRYHVREPALEVELGESFIVETITVRTPLVRTAADATPAVYREREETGPVFVRGIVPGDVLAIDILGIAPEGHASGGRWDDSDRNSLLEISEGKVHFPGGLAAPLRMMIGDIYVAPATLPRANPWDNGGNMDFKDVAAGNTLCLKAELEGGLLVLGDLHAAQGDGEIGGLGAECAGEVTLRIARDTAFRSDRPLVRKLSSFVCIACRYDYAEARNLAAQDAAKVLSHLRGCTEKEAFLYVTTVGDLRNGAVWSLGKKKPDGTEQLPAVVGLEVPLPA
jgi:amidase